MLKKNSKPKVLIALSGGVDSAVAAMLLLKKGYSVTAAYMINYDEPTATAEHCWVPDYRDALRVAASLGIPLLKLDFTKEYKEKVLGYMFKEYEAGRTPNPDVMCNKYVKFGVWLEKAKEMGFEYLATGHYARIGAEKNKTVQLLKAKDENKDQTYFLHQLSQEQLKYVLFPIGEYTKPQVRKIAEKIKLPVANKEESMGICFIGEVPMKEFLEKRIPPTPGNIVTTDGTVVGQHDGLAFYTIGQRHIGVESQKSVKSGGENRPMFVVGKNSKQNVIVVGLEDNPLLFAKEMAVSSVHWTSGQEPVFPLKCEVRLRHRQPLQKCTVTGKKGELTQVSFALPQRAITPGQFAVFYSNEQCLGGGTIEENL